MPKISNFSRKTNADATAVGSGPGRLPLACMRELTFPLEEIKSPLGEIAFPFAEFTFPRRELTFPLEEIKFPPCEIAFPLAEFTFPLTELTFPLAEFKFALAEIKFHSGIVNFRPRNPQAMSCAKFLKLCTSKKFASDEPQKKRSKFFEMYQIKNHVFAHEKNVPRTKNKILHRIRTIERPIENPRPPIKF